jgi:hypothetical protein
VAAQAVTFVLMDGAGFVLDERVLIGGLAVGST